MTTKGLLAISVLLNVGLVIGLGYWMRRASQTSQPTLPPLSSKATRAVPESRTVIQIATNVMELDWRMVESQDYRQYISNLRAIGCPEQTIRDIIIADVNQLFAAKAKEWLATRQAAPFWKAAGANNAALEAERIQKQVELNREKRRILQDLLGGDVAESSPRLDGLDAGRYSFLPKEKQQQLMDLDAVYAAKMIEIFGRVPNPPPEGDPRYQRLMADKENELAGILAPEEMEDYQVRFSRTADTVRRFLGAFEPTEDEFRRIFRAQQEFEKNFPAFDSPRLDREQRDARIAAQQQMKEQLRAELGERRFYEYEHEVGLQRSHFSKIASQYQLPKESLYNALDITWTSQEQAIRLRYDPALTAEQRQQTLASLRQQAELDLTRILGADALKAYLATRPAWVDYFKP